MSLPFLPRSLVTTTFGIKFEVDAEVEVQSESVGGAALILEEQRKSRR